MTLWGLNNRQDRKPPSRINFTRAFYNYLLYVTAFIQIFIEKDLKKRWKNDRTSQSYYKDKKSHRIFWSKITYWITNAGNFITTHFGLMDISFIKLNYNIIKHLTEILIFVLNVITAKKNGRNLHYTRQKYALDNPYFALWLSIQTESSIVSAHCFYRPVTKLEHHISYKTRYIFFISITIISLEIIAIYSGGMLIVTFNRER